MPPVTSLLFFFLLLPAVYSIKCSKSVLRDGRILYNGGQETCDVCSQFTVRTPGQTPVYIAACDVVCRDQGTLSRTYWRVENFPKELDFAKNYLPFMVYNFEVSGTCCSRDNCNDLASRQTPKATAPNYPSYRSHPETRSVGMLLSISSIIFALFSYFF